MPNHPAAPIALTPDQRTVLTTWDRSRVIPQRQVLRARIILLSGEGVPVSSIAQQLGCSEPTVRLWRSRFAKGGVVGLEKDAPGRGRPATHGQQVVGKVISVTLGAPPKGETHWSSRAVADRVGVSASTVQRIWRDHQVQPHRTQGFKFSTDDKHPFGMVKTDDSLSHAKPKVISAAVYAPDLGWPD